MHLSRALDKRDPRLLALWAADCASHVLPIFEGEHPKDDRPRKAVDAARSWARGEITCANARAAAVAAHSAARTANHGPARFSARAAGHAAATAHMAGHARHAAGYAVSAVAESHRDPERKWQQSLLPKRLRQAEPPRSGT